MQPLVVTGTDTDVGKTWVSCLIIRTLVASGENVGAWKPVCSGSVTDDQGRESWYDRDALMAALGRPVPPDQICPQCFRAAVAPPVAARQEGTTVNEQLIKSGPVHWEPEADLIVIEGAGGLLSPLSETLTIADTAAGLNAPVLIVAANRLGVVNHTLLTLETARGRNLSVAAVVLNDVSPAVEDDSQSTNFELLLQWIPDVPLLRCDFQGRSLLTADGQPFSPLRLFHSP